MPINLETALLQQLDEILAEFERLRVRSKYDDISDLPEDEIVRFVARARAAIHRIGGPSSTYVLQSEEIMREREFVGAKGKRMAGVLASLRADINSGYLRSVSELIHGELFGDFLEMAQHLVDEGYKDAAAVIAGSALEAHIRQLSQKAGIALETSDSSGIRPKKADTLNAELAKSSVYSKLDQKNVTSWLALRNDAAHGHYDRYEETQVKLLIAGIRDFISRNPA